MTALLAAGFWGYSQYQEGSWRKPALPAITHALAHGAVILGFAWAALRANDLLARHADWHWFGWLVVLAVPILLIGPWLAGHLYGLSLMWSCRYFDMHHNDAFSAVSWLTKRRSSGERPCAGAQIARTPASNPVGAEAWLRSGTDRGRCSRLLTLAYKGSDMKTTALALLATTLIGAPVAAPALAQSGTAPLEVPVIGSKGDTIGKVVLRGGANGSVLRITIAAGGLSPGWHGIHLHAVGDCSDVGQFQHSKGHVNHAAKKHGLLNPEGPDDGDLPNVFANADGSVNAEVATPTRPTGAQGLKDGDGSALVIHAAEDDHASQPIGNAGARVACAAVK